ncbi:hypothetical protein [Breznakiella homolactica]|uniref:Uncharacterized protein n=1 Tax=Breznakiella homolactica TaxID=2798577 RepID=A0A7T7XQU6_9SPIR|nr:hypothetical protein [Breznakiella homolactica]QQO10747.1 hypothetical protein JFL75_07480 [Breznakiella homolactica]
MSRNLTPEDIIPRTAYSLFTVDIPRLSGKDLAAAVRNYLHGVYPGDIERAVIAVRKNSPKKYSYLVYVFDESFAGKPLPVSSLLVKQCLKKQDADVLYIGDTWTEQIRIEQGVLCGSTVKRRDDKDLTDKIHRLYADGKARVAVFCTEGDTSLIKKNCFKYEYTLYNLEKELRAAGPRGTALFTELTPEWRQRRVLLVLLGLSILFAGTSLGYQYKQHLDAESADIRRAQELSDRKNEEARREAQRLAELRQEYALLAAEQKAGPYEIAEVISDCLDGRTQILSATIKENFFQFDAYAPDSLAVLESFEQHPRVRDSRLQQIRPSGSRERFTVSGSVVPVTEIADTGASAADQIAALERITAEMRGRNRGAGPFSASVFGARIRSMLEKSGCLINSYQYLHGDSGREMEFSIRARSVRFFGFLQEASLGTEGWEFSLVQIRNLAPQDALDVVIRVKPDAAMDFTVPQAVPQPVGGAYLPKPIAAISRNYYSAPALPPAPAAAAPPPPPEPKKTETASWLEYLGDVGDAAGESIYIKNTRTGQILRLVHGGAGDFRYRMLDSGNIEAYIDGNTYEIRRRR